MKQITIKVEDNIDYAVSDILCWLSGFIAGRSEDNYDSLLSPAIDKIRQLNIELKEKLR